MSHSTTPNMILWNKAAGPGSGLKFFPAYIDKLDERDNLFSIVNDDSCFPWTLKPKLYGTSIPQHAYHFRRTKGEIKKFSGLNAVDDIARRIEHDFQCKVSSVYCNRLADRYHHLDWHQDQYASHIMVLTLGSPRGVEFRDNKTNEVTRYTPESGDLYFMSLQHNKLYHHRVLSGVETGPVLSDPDATRISFVFFITSPFQRKEYKVSMGESLFGEVNALFS